MKLNRKVVFPVVILLLGAGAFTLLKFTRVQQPPAEIQERVWRVEVQPANPGVLSPTLTLYGTVETPQVLKAAAPAEAVVEQVLVKEGQRVAQGQLMIQLDTRDFLPQVDRARAEVTQLEAEIASEEQRHKADIQALRREQEILALARAGVDRAARLQKKSVGSDSALDEAKQAAAQQALAVIAREYSINDHQARVDQLEARLEQARAKLLEVELDLERSRLIAPFDGVISQVTVARGDRIRTADILLQMYDPASLEVRARIPAPYRDELQAAFDSGVALRGLARAAGSGVRLRLERFGGEADPSGVDGLFEIEQGTEFLRLGEVLRFQLQRPPQRNSIALPYQALYGSGRIYVLEDGRMRSIKVEALGGMEGEPGDELLVVVSDELQAGDLVVTTHLPNAITGLRAEAVQ